MPACTLLGQLRVQQGAEMVVEVAATESGLEPHSAAPAYCIATSAVPPRVG